MQVEVAENPGGPPPAWDVERLAFESGPDSPRSLHQ